MSYYQFNEPESWVIRTWENESLLFNIHSGDTLLLEGLAAYMVVSMLNGQTFSKTGLNDLVTNYPNVPSEPELSDYLDFYITELVNAGLFIEANTTLA